MIIQELQKHPMTCVIVLMYAGNSTFYLLSGKYGLALYWVAAMTITISATWLMGWGVR